jgi:hypothetical protein
VVRTSQQGEVIGVQRREEEVGFEEAIPGDAVRRGFGEEALWALRAMAAVSS